MGLSILWTCSRCGAAKLLRGRTAQAVFDGTIPRGIRVEFKKPTGWSRKDGREPEHYCPGCTKEAKA